MSAGCRPDVYFGYNSVVSAALVFALTGFRKKWVVVATARYSLYIGMDTSVGMGEVGGTNYGLLGLIRALSSCAAPLPTAFAFFFNVPHRALHHAHRLCYVLLRIICYCSVYKFYCYVLVSIASISIRLLKYVWHFHTRLKLAAVLRECLPCCWSFLPSNCRPLHAPRLYHIL